MKHCAALLILVIANCSLPSSAPVLATPVVVPFDVRALDCVSIENRDVIVRGMMRAEDSVSRCKIERDREKRDFQIAKDSWMLQRAEMEGLRVQANMFKLTLGAAIVAGVLFAISTVVAIVK